MKLLIISLSLRTRAFFTASATSCHFANEAAALDVVTDVLTVANEIKDGWVQLSPYGQFDNAQGMQEFRREDAEAIVNEFESLKNLPQRVLGLPWYIGHPDHPRFKDKYKDTKAYGRIKALEARDDGLFANVKWNPAGEALVRDEVFHGHSVNWKVRKTGAVFRPFSLKSVGFTNEPQIPVQPALANENQNTDITMPKWLIDLLLAAGLIKADATPTEEEGKALLAPIIANAGKLPAAETALANEVKSHGETKAKLTTAETSFANERKARADVLLSIAEKDGRLKPADRAQWEGDFANEFDSTATKLAALKPSIKTERTVQKLGTPELVTSTQARRERTRQMVNERMKSTGEDYDTALAYVHANKRQD